MSLGLYIDRTTIEKSYIYVNIKKKIYNSYSFTKTIFLSIYYQKFKNKNSNIKIVNKHKFSIYNIIYIIYKFIIVILKNNS